jgi:DNA-binding SARP family transcriptional activator
VEFGVLGPLEVLGVAGAVPIRRGFPRTLLIALVLKPGQVIASDTLMDLLWSDELPRNPANALQIQVSYLRKRLAAAEPDGASLLATRGSGYALQVEPDRIDARRFETAVRRFPTVDTLSSTASLASALDEVDAALRLWRGEALEDVAGMDFARGEATRLDELRWAATERRLELLLRAGRHAAAIGDLAELVQRVPLRERFHELLASLSTAPDDRATPCGPTSRRATRWPTSSASTQVPFYESCSLRCSGRTLSWTGPRMRAPGRRRRPPPTGRSRRHRLLARPAACPSRCHR